MNHSTQYMVRTLLAIAAAATASPPVYALTVEPQQAGNITFVTGGIGDEERDDMKAVKKDYNLSITSAAKDGAYVGDTHVTISDTRGQELLDTNAGPLFYAELPAGQYVIEGESGGQTHTQKITVSQNKPAHVHFSWNN